MFSSPQHSSSIFSHKTTFIPQTPSPLRTSYNANRARMNQTTSSPLSHPSCNDENDWSPAEPNGKNQQVYETPETNPFSAFATPSTTATSTSSKLFTFEQRARSLSPMVQLSKLESDSREKRKNQFYDRIRGRRESARGERLGEQVLRMDFIQARKFWEEEMARRASQEVEPSEDVDMEVDEDEMSPTEDHEIEELVSYLESKPEELDDGDEYDEAFRDLIQDDERQDTSMDMS